MGYVDSSDRMANSYSFDESTYLQVDHKIVFPASGSNSNQQLYTVFFMLGYIYPPIFQAPSGEEFEKILNHPTPRLVGRPNAGA